MTTKTKEATDNPSTSDSVINNGSFVAVCFFRPKGNYSLFIAWLQTLLGYSWEDPTHVGIWYKGCLYEMTADGFDKRTILLETVVKASAHVSYLFDYGYDEEFDSLEEELATCHREQWLFSVVDCIWYCFRVLVLNWNRPLRFFMPGDFTTVFSTVFKVPNSKSLYFAPPASCTSPVWNTFDRVDKTWDIFTPAALLRELQK
jgi:hypothetical protein